MTTTPKKYLSSIFYIVLLIVILFLFLSYFLPLLSYQEARRAVIIQESFLNQSLLPTYNGIPYFTKPPLHIWISLPFYGLGILFKNEVFGMRLLSILSYIFIAYIIYLIHKKEIEKTLLSLLILFSSFRFLSFIYRLDIEPLFILFNLTSFYFLLKYIENPSTSRALLFYFFFTCAFLVRGPLHFFLIPAYLLYGFYYKEKRLFSLLFNPLGIILFLMLVCPWFLYGYVKFGKEVFQEFFYRDIGDRLTAKKDPFYYYFKAYFLNFFPFLLLVLAKTKEIGIYWKNKSSYLFRLSTFSLFIPLILLSFTGEKFDKYLLFLFPFSSFWLAELLLYLYRQKWPFLIGTISLILNFIVITLLLYINAVEIKKESQIYLKTILKEANEKLTFFQKAHPLVLYTFKKSIPVVIKKEELYIYLKNGYLILSPELIENFSYKALLPDPYKKGEFWYLYRENLFSKNQI